MSNIKLAFERYLDFLSIQRRDSMLKWSLEQIPSSLLNPSNSRRSILSKLSLLDISTAVLPQQTEISRQGILSPLIFKPLINSTSIPNFSSFKKHIRLIKRDFTSTTTRFFDNNFDAMVDTDLSESQIREQAENRANEIFDELKLFDAQNPETYTPDIIAKASKLYDWLFLNKQYDLCYALVKSVSPNLEIFFKFNQYGKIIETFDKCGTPQDLFQFFEILKYEKIPNLWKTVTRLSEDPDISNLIKLSNVNLFQDARPLIDNLLAGSGKHDGVKNVTLRISATLYQNFDSQSRIQFYDYLMNLSSTLYQYAPPILIAKLFETFQQLNHQQFDEQYNFLEKFVTNHHVGCEVGRSFPYRLISALSKENVQTLRFKLWFNFCYEKDDLRYDREIPSIIFLRNNKLHYLPKGFENDLGFPSETLSLAFSTLIYTHSKYENNTQFGQILYRLKHKFQLSISKVDRIGYLKALTTAKKYAKANMFLQQCLDEDPSFENDETLNPILIILAKNKNWDKLENIYTERYEHNEIITKDQYITLFLALAIRPGTEKVMLDLWRNYLKRGFEPTDQIISSIIQGYLNIKSYQEALQWFTAYSHYDVKLSSRSYGFMIQALACMNELNSAYKVLDELVNLGTRLHKSIFVPVFVHLAKIGDYKSIEHILTYYYPKFNISVEREDTRWIMMCHYHANRFDIIIDSYLHIPDSVIAYKDSLLALDTAIKFKELKTFEKIWNRAYTIHSSRGDLDISAYVSYMSYWVRKYGGFGLEMKLQEIRNKLAIRDIPTVVFNQMIFSALRTHRPWLTKKIVRISLMNDVVPSPKMYSLILQSNVSMPWVARNSIDETITILEELLSNRKEDKLGKLNDDINPMSLKLVIKSIAKYKSVYEARRLFEMYLDSARNNTRDNIHVCATELLILGEEERWIEFDKVYEEYLDMILKYNDNARLKQAEATLDEFDTDLEFNRLNRKLVPYLENTYDENKIKRFTDHRVKIPNWIKKSHYDIWIYRLRQLETADKSGEVCEIVESLISKGIVFSNHNLNETALFLSSRPECLEVAAAFIDKFILPYHIKNKSFDKMKLRHKTDKIPGVRREPVYQFDSSVYFDVVKNLSISLDQRLSSSQRESLLESVSYSPNKYILKNLRYLLQERRHIRHNYLRMKKMRTQFYRTRRVQCKARTRKLKMNMSMWRLEESFKYKTKMKDLMKHMKYLTSNIKKISPQRGETIGRKEYKRMQELIEKKSVVTKQVNALHKLRKAGLRKLYEEAKRKGGRKTYRVGTVDFSKL